MLICFHDTCMSDLISSWIKFGEKSFSRRFELKRSLRSDVLFFHRTIVRFLTLYLFFWSEKVSEKVSVNTDFFSQNFTLMNSKKFIASRIPNTWKINLFGYPWILVDSQIDWKQVQTPHVKLHSPGRIHSNFSLSPFENRDQRELFEKSSSQIRDPLSNPNFWKNTDFFAKSQCSQCKKTGISYTAHQCTEVCVKYSKKF